MPDNLRLGIRLEANAKGFTGEMRLADRELDKLSRRLGQTPGPARAAAATDEFTRSTRSAGRAFLDAHGRHVKYLSSLASIEVFRRAARAAGRPHSRARGQPGQVRTSWRCSPSPPTPRRITSPVFRKRWGLWPAPTPGGVPVGMTSPGSRVM